MKEATLKVLSKVTMTIKRPKFNWAKSPFSIIRGRKNAIADYGEELVADLYRQAGIDVEIDHNTNNDIFNKATQEYEEVKTACINDTGSFWFNQIRLSHSWTKIHFVGIYPNGVRVYTATRSPELLASFGHNNDEQWIGKLESLDPALWTKVYEDLDGDLKDYKNLTAAQERKLNAQVARTHN